MRQIDFGYEPLEPLTADRIGACMEGMDLMAIGIAGGGNNILAVSLSDPTSEDPTVHFVDHYIPDRYEFSSTTMKLSQLLAKLVPQEEVDRLEEEFDVQY